MKQYKLLRILHGIPNTLLFNEDNILYFLIEIQKTRGQDTLVRMREKLGSIRRWQ